MKLLKILLLKAAKAIKNGRNILENRTVFSLTAIFTTSLAIFLLTGLLYFRNEVIITDGDSVTEALTAFDLPEAILAEHGFELSENDYYIFSGFENNIAYLDIIRFTNTAEIAETTPRLSEIEPKDIPAVTYAELGESEEYSPETTALSEISEFIETIFTPESSAPISTADISIKADGTVTGITVEISKNATGRTVAAILEANGITVGDDDLVTPPLTDIINEDAEIVVRRVKYTERITVNPIPYETEYIESTLHAIGYTDTVTQGINGSEQVTTREMLVDGAVASSEVIEVTVTNEPVTEVQIIGTSLAVPYSKREFEEIDLNNGLPADYEYVVSGKACAYTAGPKAGTASGRDLIIGTVAVDPNIIPYGSLLYIVTQDGSRVYGAAVAADTGYLTDVVVDLYMGLTSENYDDACNWGARYVDVYVINTGKY